MPGKKKSLDLSPLSYFVDIPQREETLPQAAGVPSEPPQASKMVYPAPVEENGPQEAAAALEKAETKKERRPGRPNVEKENRSKIFSICMTPSLYEDLRLLSELHGISVNSYIVGLLDAQVDENRASVDQIKAIKKKFNRK